MYYVYKTTNKENGKYYVGVHKSENIQNDSYLGSGYILAKALEKYGKETFIREILFEYETPEEAFAKEREIVNEEFVKNDQTYNIALGGHGGKLTEINPFFGKHHSDETKELLSEINTGKTLSEETKQKISSSLLEHYDSLSEEEKQEQFKNLKRGEDHYMFGVTVSDDELKRLSTLFLGRKHTDESKQKMSQNSVNKGIPKSEEFKQHLSNILTGRTNEWVQITNKNPEKIRKTAEKHRGMKRSEEACKNISASKIGKQVGCNNNEFKGYWVTPFGKFDSLKSASEASGNSVICIRDRCLAKNENKIAKQSTIKDPKISENNIGKTWKEIGWGFEPVIKEKL